MRFPGYCHYGFVTIVDDEQLPARIAKTRKQAESAKKNLATCRAHRSMRRTGRSACVLVE